MLTALEVDIGGSESRSGARVWSRRHCATQLANEKGEQAGVARNGDQRPRPEPRLRPRLVIGHSDTSEIWRQVGSET
jgi:hypothetical protein